MEVVVHIDPCTIVVLRRMECRGSSSDPVGTRKSVWPSRSVRCVSSLPHPFSVISFQQFVSANSPPRTARLPSHEEAPLTAGLLDL